MFSKTNLIIMLYKITERLRAYFYHLLNTLYCYHTVNRWR